MNFTRRLLHQCCVTLFTRSNCSLCDNAKKALSDAWDKKPFNYHEINIMKPEHKKWRDLYEFDSPVIHISLSDKEMDRYELPPIKLMHRFSTQEILAQMEKLLNN